MRRFVFAFLWIISPVCFSCTKCMCKYLLDIIIVNATGSDCILINQTLNNGYVYSRNIPLRINRGEESPPYTFEYDLSNGVTNVSLSLQCGEDKFVSLQTNREYKRGYLSHSEELTGTVIGAADLDATYVAKKSDCDKPKAASIYWTLVG